MAKFELPPPEHRPASVESWKTPTIQAPPSLGPPPLLLMMVGIEVALALLSLARWEPEELLVPFCPALQAVFALIVGFYTYRGKNAARVLAFVSAAFWMVAAFTIARARTDLIGALPSSTRIIIVTRACFEVLFALFLMKPDVSRFFEKAR